MNELDRSIDVASLLPHGGAARMIRSVLEIGPGRIVCVGEIPEENPFVVQGRCPSIVALELAAQAAALLEALQRTSQGGETGPRDGYLVRVRGVRLSVPYVAAREPLTARLHQEGVAPPLAIYGASVSGTDGELLRGTFSTYVDLGAD